MGDNESVHAMALPLSDGLLNLSNNYLIRNIRGVFRKLTADTMSIFYLSILVIFILLALVGPWIAPYPPNETMYNEAGDPLINEPPSLSHPLGTNSLGYDLYSRILYGARPTMIAGLLGGSIIISIGLTVGVSAGYFGGMVENVLMRVTDFAYGIPLYPFAIVIIPLLGVGYITSIVVIGLLLWRGSARVIRSQVLQLKKRPYVKAARATGASHPRIILIHILPNVGSMAILFFAIGTGYTIILQAGLAFLGVTSPFVPSWGVIIRNAYTNGYMISSWWWSLPPGFLIALTVLATFMTGRAYETDSESSIAKMG